MNIAHIIDILLAPLLTGLLAWFASAYRNKQKKEKDMLDNVKQMLDIQNEFIGNLKQRIDDGKEDKKDLQVKYDRKVRAIKEAYDCEHPSENCPVLIYDKQSVDCDDCDIRKGTRKQTRE